MAEIHLIPERTSGAPGEVEYDCWTASADVGGSPHTDAVAMSIEGALFALAKKLADHIEESEASGRGR